MERLNIQYHGMDIPVADRGQIKAHLGFLMGDAPSDASMCCCLSLEPEGYAANIHVHSATGHVFIHRESKSLEQLMVYLSQSMKDSFEKWHKDPQHFAKNHPMEKHPCRGASHRKLQCPLDPS
jgi:hypothetical protein